MSSLIATLNVRRQEFNFDRMGQTISFFRLARGTWNASVIYIPSDVFEPVLAGLNFGYGLGILSSLQIPSLLKSTYNVVTGDSHLAEKGITVLAYLGDIGASVAISLQSVAVIVEIAQPYLQFATPLLFVSVSFSACHLAEYTKELMTKDVESPEYKIAQLKAVATVVSLIAVTLFLTSTPAAPGLVLVGFGLCAVASTLNFRAASIKYQASLDAFERSNRKVGALCRASQMAQVTYLKGPLPRPT